MSEIFRRPSSLSCDPLQAQARSEVLGDEKRKDLSPGLCYLEQVCQMLEEIARQQMHSRALQMEMDALREHQEMEASQPADTCQNDSKAAEEDPMCSQNQGKANSLDYRRKSHPYGHFRQRSASDTTIALMHLKMTNTDCRGQHLTEKSLQEEEVHKEQPTDAAI
ncbi:uncharacterized protein si:dkey-106l3.7 isoform X2 [Cheilinus undulatus]|uniref:uncharacterized protein si:dkey-106l3.7 isoform X2 n=1 Tax=Cheilinus undulatus TaxID=241271 RepID=UPI001BD37C7A|nr:uncharacterized protein si:dkey-106l3.7 isoform X2 [Cheilinus undulatus]